MGGNKKRDGEDADRSHREHVRASMAWAFDEYATTLAKLATPGRGLDMGGSKKRDNEVRTRVNDVEMRTIESMARLEGITIAEAMRKLIQNARGTQRGDTGRGGTKRES